VKNVLHFVDLDMHEQLPLHQTRCFWTHF